MNTPLHAHVHSNTRIRFTVPATIKLVGTAKLTPDKSALSVYVSPVVVPLEHPVASARGSTNMVTILSENLTSSAYVGPGAGRFPTANSVVNDILRVAMNASPPAFPIESDMPFEADFTARFYMRISVSDQLGIIANVGALAQKHGVSIFAVLQNPITDPTMVDFVVTTSDCRHSQVQAMADEVATQGYALKRPLIMTKLGDL